MIEQQTTNKVDYDIILLAGNDSSLRSTRPYGAHKCARELRIHGFKTLVVNHIYHFSESDLKDLLEKCVSKKTLFVGISNSYMPKFVTRLIETVKPCLPSGCKLVMGGAFTEVDTFYENIDYTVLGFADLSIVNLAKHLRDGEQLRRATKNIFGSIQIDDPVAEGFNISTSKMEWHPDDMIFSGERVLPLEISRGCIFSCKFCSYPLIGKKNNDHIKLSSILREELLENHEKYGITTYRILDDTFNDNIDKLDSFLEVVRSLPFSPKFWAYIRLDLLSKHPETIQKLVDIGVISMTFGIETLNQETGRIIGKGYNPTKLVETINYIKDTYGNSINMFGHFIIGLPKESPQSTVDTANRIKNKQIKLDGWAFKPLGIKMKNKLVWDSAFNLDLKKYGYVDKGMYSRSDSGIMINWRNEFMTYDEAVDLGKQISSSNSFAVGFQEFEIMNLGIDTRDPNINYNFHSVNVIFKEFLEQYKKYVFSYLNSAEYSTGA